MKKALFCITCFCFGIGTFAQTKVEIGFQAGPMFSALVDPSIRTSNGYTPTLALGPKMKWTIDRLQLNAGIIHIEQVDRITFQHSAQFILHPVRFQTTILKKQILVPLTMHYAFLNKTNLKLAFGGGTYMGIDYEETSILNNNSAFETASISKTRKPYAGLNIGIGMQVQISPKISFEIRPNMLYELENIRHDFNFGTSMLSYGTEFGVYAKIPGKCDNPN